MERTGVKYNTTLKVEHIWDREHDCWIYVQTNENGEIGLNFMQGDEYEHFVEMFCHVDIKISNLYKLMKDTFPAQHNQDKKLEFINRVIDTYRYWGENLESIF